MGNLGDKCDPVHLTHSGQARSGLFLSQGANSDIVALSVFLSCLCVCTSHHFIQDVELIARDAMSRPDRFPETCQV